MFNYYKIVIIGILSVMVLKLSIHILEFTFEKNYICLKDNILSAMKKYQQDDDFTSDITSFLDNEIKNCFLKKYRYPGVILLMSNKNGSLANECVSDEIIFILRKHIDSFNGNKSIYLKIDARQFLGYDAELAKGFFLDIVQKFLMKDIELSRFAAFLNYFYIHYHFAQKFNKIVYVTNFQFFPVEIALQFHTLCEKFHLNHDFLIIDNVLFVISSNIDDDSLKDSTFKPKDASRSLSKYLSKSYKRYKHNSLEEPDPRITAMLGRINVNLIQVKQQPLENSLICINKNL